MRKMQNNSFRLSKCYEMELKKIPHKCYQRGSAVILRRKNGNLRLFLGTPAHLWNENLTYDISLLT